MSFLSLLSISPTAEFSPAQVCTHLPPPRPPPPPTPANCCLFENIKQSLDRGNMVGAVFLHFKKAFDTVNHHLVLPKLLSFGFSSEAIKWFTCFFLNNNMGIPQGSILGPLLFSLVINDLALNCSAVTCQLYIDDTAAKTPVQAVELISSGTFIISYR